MAGFKCQGITEMPIGYRKENEIAWAFKTWKGFDCQAWNNQRIYFVVNILDIQEGKKAYEDFIRNI